MKIVVTGATGNVGAPLVRRLAGEGRVEQIVGIARRLPAGAAPPKVRFAAADVARDPLRPHLEGADVVVHLAWAFLPQRRPVDTWTVNVLGSLRVFEAAAEAGAGAVVHASSVGAYSPRVDETPVDESWPTDAWPSAAYGREKSYLERRLDDFERRWSGLRVVRVRSAFVFQRAAANEQLRIFGGPLAAAALRRLWPPPLLAAPRSLLLQTVHADDLAEAYAACVLGSARGAFNVAAEPVLDGRALADALGARYAPAPDSAARAAVALAYRLRLVPTDPGLLDLALTLPVMDAGRARRELGWAPRRSAIDAVRELAAGVPDTPPTGPSPLERGGPQPAPPAPRAEAGSGVAARARALNAAAPPGGPRPAARDPRSA